MSYSQERYIKDTLKQLSKLFKEGIPYAEDLEKITNQLVEQVRLENQICPSKRVSKKNRPKFRNISFITF